MRNRFSIFLILFTVISMTNSAVADVLKPAKCFSSHMVLQRDQPIKVWGSGKVGATVKVNLAQQSRDVTVGPDGKWSVIFAARPASTDPVTLKINDITFDDILLGDVWLCSGQSNMAYALKGTKLAPALTPNIRLLKYTGLPLVAKKGFTKAQLARCKAETFFQGRWVTPTKKDASGFSAVGWLFGQNLYAELNVPIGLIQVAVGGSAINNWIPCSTLRKLPLTEGLFTKDWMTNEEVFINHRKRGQGAMRSVLKANTPWLVGKTEHRWMCEPGFLFEAGIAPLKGLGLKGVVWYQGESDAYAVDAVERAGTLFPIQIKAWREVLGSPELPFLFVQLPGFGRDTWPAFREIQRQASLAVPNTAMAVALDTGNKKNIHPSDKKPIGERLAKLALGVAYKKPITGFPQCASTKIDGGAITLTLSGVGTGMRPVKGQVTGFEVAGDDGVFKPAAATMTSPRTIAVTSPVGAPKTLRYAWQPYPDPPLALFNSAGLPLGPFVLTVSP